jgi:NAD(P)-dependent dehydrogenase (short-subunit alcohol dehydrogenase family)
MPFAIVTGAGAGIGAAIARRLAHDGFTIVVADIDSERAHATTAALEGAGHRALSVQVDVSDARSVDALVHRVLQWSPEIDVLVNNAGIVGPHGQFAEYPRDDMLKVINVDLIGTMLCTQAVLPAMIARRAGRVVNIASIAGKDGSPQLAPYAAAKGGVIAFTKSIARELASTGVIVNAVAPGGVGGTEITQAVDPSVADDIRARAATSTPMGRLAVPDEIAALVAWLCSPQCSYSTGAVYDISGGRATY